MLFSTTSWLLDPDPIRFANANQNQRDQLDADKNTIWKWLTWYVGHILFLFFFVTI